MTMMTGTMVAMDLCISNCWGNMLMSMLLGAIMTVMVIKYMDYKKKMAWVKEKKHIRNSWWMSSDSC